MKIAREHLERNKLAQTESPPLPTTEFTLPRLQGNDIEEHFYRLGAAHSAPYLDLAKAFADASLPPKPDAWVRVSGWIRYNIDGSYEPVAFPPDDALAFDVETLYKLQPFAVMATAASRYNWYSWVSPWLLGESEDPQQLIPFASPKPRLLVGHNVGYDRARIQEEYHLERTQNRFLDTMSLHVAVTGLSSHQRAPWMKYKKLKQARLQEAAEAGLSSDASTGPRWEEVSAMSSLEHVAKLHCGIDLDKSARDYFSSEDKQDVLDHFQDLMGYCASDVSVTHSVFSVVLPAFLSGCPNPVTFAGILAMGNSFLPVDKAWQNFLEKAEGLYNKLTNQVDLELQKLADQARRLMSQRDANGIPEFEKDPWLSQLDWTPKKARDVDIFPAAAQLQAIEGNVGADAVPQDKAPGVPAQPDTTQMNEPVIETVAEIRQSVMTDDSSNSDVAGSPRWYTQLLYKEGGGITRQAAETIVPLLLRTSIHGRPMQYDETFGWIYGMPEDSARPHTYAQLVHPNPFGQNIIGYQPFKTSTRSLLSARTAKLLADGVMSSPMRDLMQDALAVGFSSRSPNKDTAYLAVESALLKIASDLRSVPDGSWKDDPWLSQLNWSGYTPQKTADPPRVEEQPTNVQKSDEASQPAPPPNRSRRRASSLFPGNERVEPATPEAPSRALSRRPMTPSPRIPSRTRSNADELDENSFIWPKWFWDMYKPRPDQSGPNLTIRSKAAPLLLRLRWRNYPLFHSRQHGWLYRAPKEDITDEEERDEAGQLPVIGGTKQPNRPSATRRKTAKSQESKPEKECPSTDLYLYEDRAHFYYKLPHKDGGDANVGTPLAKTFIPAFEDGTLSSEFVAAKAALDMNAQCSYWISARERVMNQLVVWKDAQRDRGFPQDVGQDPFGMILPQVVTMGTVTRRAVESTWLAASNAKKNRLGSELKAMIRAPPGHSIVGADVDSEELWICSVMGDAQFGFHGATAIGWMTLEGTKAAGTDLHSKTASIMGITRDQAKVFNYSRLYGAGVKHAVQLLLQGNPKLSKEEATHAAKQLYSATKGDRVHQARPPFNRKLWYGGTESHVFNKLEDVATANDPRTPALGCGITSALAKKNLPATEMSKAGEDFMPSRINWVVQSSGVDYLHLLIVSMEYLIRRVCISPPGPASVRHRSLTLVILQFDISARFMISVHDEIRYLVKDEDKHRAALALQISNIWTRALFAHRLQMESLPQVCIDVLLFLYKLTNGSHISVVLRLVLSCRY